MNQYIREYQEGKYRTKIIETLNNFPQDMKAGELKIFHKNIRSIVRNFDELIILLDYLPLTLDIIVLSETFQLRKPEIFNISGYKTIYNKANLNRNDGLLVFLRKDMDFTHKIITLGEIKSIAMSISGANALTLTALYRSPQTCVKNFNKEVYTYLEKRNHA